tara:strand:+ start:868 stop:1062 length:195 start_codon:yes stop_codon:yes gene_type:complete
MIKPKKKIVFNALTGEFDTIIEVLYSYTYNKHGGDVFVEEDFTLTMNCPTIEGEIKIDGELYIL